VTQCCIVGAGPAGAVLALLLARQGVAVTLLEAHLDLERDFRGDTVHPSTLELMESLGLVDRLLAIPHIKISDMPMHTRAGTVTFGGYPRTRLIKSRYPNAMLLPQARFLELLTSEARRYPSFRMVMGARVESLIEDAGFTRGVRYRSQTDGCLHEIPADLTVAADGRFSKIRQLVGFKRVGVAQPIDCLWFRLPHFPTDAPDVAGVYLARGRVIVVFDRGPEWQASYWLPKGGYGV